MCPSGSLVLRGVRGLSLPSARRGAARCAVEGVGVPAVFAAAGGHAVGGDGAVPVDASRGVRLGDPKVQLLGRRISRGSGPVEEAEGEQQLVAGDLGRLDVGGDRVQDVRVEFQAPVFAVFGVVLDQEPAALGMELRHQLEDHSRHGEHPAEGVDVERAQFAQFAPAQPRLDIGLHQQSRRVVGQLAVDLVELGRGHDGAHLLGHGRGLHAAAGMQGGELVVERGGEDRGQDREAGPDHGGGHPGVLHRRPAENSPMLRFLLWKATASIEAGMDLRSALTQLAVHAWFEGGVENYDRGRRDATR
jgi:hypothetical protein